MKDLSAFENGCFDLIIHPWSNGYVDTVLPVWKEAARVIRQGGILISGFGNPVEYIFDLEKLNQGEFVVRHKIPYSDLTSISEEEFKHITKDEGILFGHTLTDQIQGQIDAGFDIGGTALDNYIYTSIATKAIKL